MSVDFAHRERAPDKGAALLTPRFLPVRRTIRESHDAVTIELLDEAGRCAFAPGQFNMLYLFGAGEVAISISGDPADAGALTHTIRAVGSVTSPLSAVKRGTMIGVRGPYGRGWPLGRATERKATILALAGGIGLAPLRGVAYHFFRNRESFDRLIVLCGARTSEDLLYARELERWRAQPGLELSVIVDRGDSSWTGRVGVLTDLLKTAQFDAANTIAMICGPEVMMRIAAGALRERGMAANDIYLSMERNMKCATGTCGHCQFGPHFVCKDGPVFALSEIAPILGVREV